MWEMEQAVTTLHGARLLGFSFHLRTRSKIQIKLNIFMFSLAHLCPLFETKYILGSSYLERFLTASRSRKRTRAMFFFSSGNMVWVKALPGKMKRRSERFLLPTEQNHLPQKKFQPLFLFPSTYIPIPFNSNECDESSWTSQPLR